MDLLAEIMNESDLEKFAEDVRKLIEAYEIDAAKFAMSIHVTPSYFERAKENFPDRTDDSPHPDLGFSRHGKRWAIAVMNYQPRSFPFEDEPLDAME